MSFNGQSNTPWQRNNVMGSFHQSPSSQQMYMQPQQQSNMPAFSHGSAVFPSTGNTISYPRTTGLNPVAFAVQSPGNVQSQHYNSIGTVTKMNNDCGLVNEEVFFYRNVCKGHAPKLGDRVLFEASYLGGKFKWIATRIQIMPSHPPQPQPLMGSASKGSGYSAVPPPNEYQRAQQQRHHSPKRSSPTGRDRNARTERDRRDRERNRSRERDEDDHDRKRRREDSDRGRDRTNWLNNRGSGRNDRSDSHERKEREREKDRDRRERDSRVERTERSPRRTRTIRRYSVRIPKCLLTYKTADVQELRQRYPTLYVPSDFFHANIKWSEFFGPDDSTLLHRPCQFHIKHKMVQSPIEQTIEDLEPADADYVYSAKVMLLSCPPIAEIYQKCFDDDDNDSEPITMHPSRLISFLVGTRGRNEPMAIGGPWSPSLDGENPDTDPAVLIRTAIRTCRALTGIDLSNCTQWYRFVELYYHRTDYKHKKKDADARIETVVIYLPDIHSCMPSNSEWQTLTNDYKILVDNILSSSVETRKGSVDIAVAEATNPKADNSPDVADVDNSGSAIEVMEVVPSTSAFENERSIDETGDADSSLGQDATVNAENNDNEKDDAALPTHHSKLDLKNMKLQELRDELTARNLPAKGVRNMLMARLAKAVNAEKAEELASKKKEEAHIQKATATTKNDNVLLNAAKNLKSTLSKKGTKQESQFESKERPTAIGIDNTEDAVKEDQEEWSDVVDVDMSDIVILDEYDSNKNQEVPDGSNEILDAKLKRRYGLPSDPHIIVHPNKFAKGGKFDCTTMSLSLLLDYGPEDTKERFFEVSLFAEIFNEMLMRDFGFNIYKAVYLYKELHAAENTDPKDNKEPKEEGVIAEKVKENNENNTNADASRERTSKRTIDEEQQQQAQEEDTQSLKSAVERKRKSIVLASSRDKEYLADKKMIVAKPELLLSFYYFDTTHCGYIFDKDLEELFSILGLKLSRGQIRKVIGKLSVRQSFYYRKLTHKEETSTETVPAIEEIETAACLDIEKLALGNNHFDFVFNKVECVSNAAASATNDDGLITYNGVVIHVGKLVEQIKRTEKNLSDLDKLYNDIRKQHTDLQKEHSKSSSKIKDLQSEVKSLNRKLSDADQDLYSLNRKQREHQSALSYIYNRVAPFFNREKDKDHCSRDKDSKDKQKDGENKDWKTNRDKPKNRDHPNKNIDEKTKTENGEMELSIEKDAKEETMGDDAVEEVVEEAVEDLVEAEMVGDDAAYEETVDEEVAEEDEPEDGVEERSNDF